LERTAAWRIVDSAVAALEANHDLTITTARPYVTGYVCRQLADAGLPLDATGRQSSAATRIRAPGDTMPGDVDYRIDFPLDDDSLNALFSRAWPDHRRRSFAGVLERSLGTVTAFAHDRLIGFANLATDGGEHAFLLDPTVDPLYRGRGIGGALVLRAASIARERHCRWLHVDYEPQLERFYSRAGFRLSAAGVMLLDPTASYVASSVKPMSKE
jgi:GNAT superfamily N-acetyltransferase